MDNSVRQRLNEIRKKQLESQPINRYSTESTATGQKSQYVAVFAGVAVGITMAVLAWLAWSLMTTNQGNHNPTKLQIPIHTSDIKQANEQIEHLSTRIDLLTDSISGLEERLAHLTTVSESTVTIGPNISSTDHKDNLVPETTQTRSDKQGRSDSGAVTSTVKAESVFVPTHRVFARVNLRPSPSVDTIPITTLNVGTNVQYIREDGAWFYVDTEVHGKGWCVPEYLSPIQ